MTIYFKLPVRKCLHHPPYSPDLRPCDFYLHHHGLSHQKGFDRWKIGKERDMDKIKIFLVVGNT